MKVLVLCGDYWHPAEVIRRGMEALAGKEFQFDFVEDAKDILYPEMLRQYDVIMNCKMNHLSESNQTEWFQPGVTEVTPEHFRQFVEQGGGFLAVHGGAAYDEKDSSGYTDFLGCFFVRHPARCDIQLTVEQKHPVTEGVDGFVYHDEHYCLSVTAKDAQELCTTHSATGGDQVGGYVRSLGKGRMCMLAPGHVLSTWMQPEFQRMVENALRWCAGKE